MKLLSLEELDIMLCSTGYLPPRTEDELLFFNELYEDYQPHIIDRNVDVESILNGTCRIVSNYGTNHETEWGASLVAEQDTNHYSMAARNFDKLPEDILDKMKKQHRLKDNDDK